VLCRMPTDARQVYDLPESIISISLEVSDLLYGRS